MPWGKTVWKAEEKTRTKPTNRLGGVLILGVLSRKKIHRGKWGTRIRQKIKEEGGVSQTVVTIEKGLDLKQPIKYIQTETSSLGCLRVDEKQEEGKRKMEKKTYPGRVEREEVR